MRTKTIVWTLLGVVLVGGCKTGPTSSDGGLAPGMAKADPDKQTAVTTGGSKPPDKIAKPSTMPVKIVSKEMKNDAYVYYGLANNQPVDMEMKRTGFPTSTGSETTTLKDIKDGNPIYEVARTGGLDVLGTEELSLEKGGIYAISTSLGKASPPHQLEMPAKVTPGTSWKTDYSIETQQGQKVKDSSIFKVVGTQKVTTKAGDFDALLITSSGTIALNGEPSKTKTRSWYVKNRGLVKMQIETIDKKGLKKTVEMQETK